MAGLDEFAAFCEDVLVLDNGEPFVLEDFQRWLLEPYFAGADECVLSTPKGCGKSTLLGALALFELLRSPEADIVVAAAARDQAQVLLGQAQGFVRRQPALMARLRMTRREVEHPALNGRARVISSDASTGDGLIPSHVLVDELHRWRSGDLFSTLRVSLSKRGGRMLTISTPGVVEESPLWPLRQRALALGARRDGVRLSADGTGFALRELSAPDDADWRDLGVAQEVNPLVTRDQLERRFDGAERDWRRYTLGQWVEAAAEERVISPDTWEALRDGSPERADGLKCFAVDVPLERDTATIAVAGWRGDKLLVEIVESGMGVAWVPERLVKLTEQHRCLPVIVDNVGPSGALVPRIEEWGVEVRATSTVEFARSCSTFLDLIAEDRLRHRDDPPLTMAVQGAVTRPLVDTRAWSRRKSLSDVSPLVAASLAAWGLMTLGPVKEGPFSAAAK